MAVMRSVNLQVCSESQALFPVKGQTLDRPSRLAKSFGRQQFQSHVASRTPDTRAFRKTPRAVYTEPFGKRLWFCECRASLSSAVASCSVRRVHSQRRASRSSPP